MSKQIKTSTYRNGRYTTVTYYKGGRKPKPHFTRELSFGEKTGWTHWQEHCKLFAIIILFGVLMSQLKIAIPHVYAQLQEKMTVTYTVHYNDLVSPLPKQTNPFDFNVPSPKPTPQPIPDDGKKKQIQEIESYVKEIFKMDDSKLALAISHHECPVWNRDYPACELKSSVEDSIGLFQINLYNSKQWIHAGRIPGETMAEKIEWLRNPYNNTLYAYWVYKTSGWNPWSAYTTGRYLADY